MSSVYSMSIGRIPVGCVYAVKAEATIKNTEVIFFPRNLGPFSEAGLHSTFKTAHLGEFGCFLI